KDEIWEENSNDNHERKLMFVKLMFVKLAEMVPTVNDVTRLQALVDKKKVVITKAMIRDALRLDDAEGVECFSNEEIFTELARMGYEKPSKQAYFLQGVFLKPVEVFDPYHNAMKQVGDLSTHTTKYTSPALTPKVFANMRRVGKGFFGVETPLFEGIIVEQHVVEGADEVHDEGVPAAGIVAEGDVSAANDEVPIADEGPSIPSPTPPTPPPQPSQDIPSSSQAQPTLPQSPQVQPQSPQQQLQPSQDAGISMDLLQNLMDTYTTLTRRVEHLEQDKIAQALEITKLKQRVKKLEKRNKLKVLKLRRLKRVGSAQRINTSNDTVMDDVSKQEGIIKNINADEDVVLEDAKDVGADVKDGQDADIDKNADIQGRTAESQAQIYKIDLKHANKVLSMQDEEESEPTELQEVVDVVTTAKIITKVVTAASTTITATDVSIPAATTAAAPTLTAAPSRRTNGVVIRDPQETTTPSIIIHSEAKSKDKGKGILVEEPKPLKKEDLEALWRLVKERFATTNPKNFSDDFLLITFGAMFEKPDIHAQIWKNQRSVHGQAKVKSWKLLESCGVQIITFTTTQLILWVERRYPLTRFTLDQMLNNVRLEVEEESEVSLELLTFIRQQHQEGAQLDYGVDAAMDFKEKHAKCLMLLVKDLVLPSQDDDVD
nr:hypothetical protein [Tanacetum cinerariifolium]